jgi:hypothetical protein
MSQWCFAEVVAAISLPPLLRTTLNTLSTRTVTSFPIHDDQFGVRPFWKFSFQNFKLLMTEFASKHCVGWEKTFLRLQALNNMCRICDATVITYISGAHNGARWSHVAHACHSCGCCKLHVKNVIWVAYLHTRLTLNSATNYFLKKVNS